jgi:hypothetical protein
VDLGIAVPNNPATAKPCFDLCLKEWKITYAAGYLFRPLDCANRCEQRDRQFEGERTPEEQEFIRRRYKEYNASLDGNPA